MPGARSHEELAVWKLAYELKLGVYALIKRGPITRDLELRDQLRDAARSAPRLIAEGYGRYLPGEFARYLRLANGELKETLDALRDGIDCGHFTREQVIPLHRLIRRASKANANFIRYLRTANPPHESRGRSDRRRDAANSNSSSNANLAANSNPTPDPNPDPTPDPNPTEPPEPSEPPEQDP